ncbi:hypothetical protein GE115_14890 [Agromyces sp. CFH 90414]|uniref:PH domain-containing protein n=1 Tax=Agromyces agglutinans TaxID=2662258 RepID=A0A6I2F932_9MICO|nr:hypothetical protein [Agromyces agglutinans]MRG61139.1 hypothetical protein [Agromyces agglutinans]
MLSLRPRRSLAIGIGLQIAIVALPLIGIVAWTEQQSHPGVRSALVWAVLIIAASALYAVFRYRRTGITVSRYGVVERGFFGRTASVSVRDIAAVVRLDLYRGASDETTPQLFIVDRDGRCLVRMRGAFWDEAAMDAVADFLDMEQTVRRDPVSAAELHASDPKLLYWWERPFVG